MQLNSVVLPAPLGPMTPTICPFWTSKLTPSSAAMPPKRTQTFVQRSSGAWGCTVTFSEDNGSGSVHDDPSFEVRPHRAREHHALHVTPHASEIGRAHPVIDAHDVLLDDRALVQVLRRVVRRRADELDPPGVRLAVRLRALKCGQEAMMDVDDRRRLAQEALAHDLHVPPEHHEVDPVPRQELEDLEFLMSPRRIHHGQAVVRDAKAGGDLLERGMVADDERNVAQELALAMPEEQIVKT